MEHISVIVVGGGPVGLTAAHLLQHFGVPFTLVEREKTDSILPRARGWAVRTVEIFRQLGLEEAAQRAAMGAWKQGSFGGARCGVSLVESKPLTIPTIKNMGESDPSPSQFCACPQSLLEPVLREPLVSGGADLRYGQEVVGLAQSNDSITVRLRDVQGNETDVCADYVIGADGGRSFVRSSLGIGASGSPPDTHYVNIFFRANLQETVRGRTFSQCKIVSNEVRGLFLSKNNTDEWSFHLEYDPSCRTPLNSGEDGLTRLLRTAIGIEDVPIQILAQTTWSTAVRVADTYQSGRVFLAGDAAHTMPPWGGFNGNTGIADVHNLIWKLAAVLHGKADQQLLSSYTAERRPVATRNGKQALLRTDFEARFEVETEANRSVFAELSNAGACLMRYQYGPDAECGSTETGLVKSLLSQPGTRFPHAWIEMDGERRSTLDLFGKDWVLLQGPACENTPQLPSSYYKALDYKTVVSGRDFRWCDPQVDWSSITGRGDAESVFVRPDGFVSL